ncbi:MAG: hypothetical protein KKF44_11475 [Nanoarchaeota archaeon]|nr:hypothetical protein [Nanoarchaeota archaeon]
MFNKMLFFVLLFALIDIVNSYIDLHYKIDILLDFSVIGIILLSYWGYIGYVPVSMAFFFLSRFILGKLSKRHFLKIPVMVIIACLAMQLNHWNLGFLGVFLYFIRYLMEYLLEFILSGSISLDRIPRRVLHMIATYLFFAMIGG